MIIWLHATLFHLLKNLLLRVSVAYKVKKHESVDTINWPVHQRKVKEVTMHTT